MADSNNPLVTLALFAYNQERYVRQAVEGALAQDYSPLQIILSDDHSSDGTFQVMQEIVSGYKGPHVIRLNRNLKNMGVGAHVNALMRMVEADFVVIAAGDDVSMPGRTRRLVSEWTASGARTACIYSDLIAIDEDSSIIDTSSEAVCESPRSLASMAYGDIRVLGATTAVTKDVFDRLPELSPAVMHEDRVLPFRALLLGGRVMFVNEKLVKYRVTSGISRQLPSSLRDYLDVYTPSFTTRTLPDAVQRLSDLLIAQPENRFLRQACETAIADQEAKLDMHFSGRWCYEMVFIKWLFRGVQKKLWLKHYLKMRFLRVFG